MNGKTNVTVSGGNDSLGGIIPLNPPTAFVVTADNAKCLLTWTDPLDKYADDLGQITDEGDQLVSQFAFTRIVRKEGGYPGTPDDGVTVTESSVRNQYQSSVYTDEGLTNNITYYYAAFTCNTDGVWSGSVTGSATPKAYDPILGNNTWEQINEVANEGIAASVWEVGDKTTVTFKDMPQYGYDVPAIESLPVEVVIVGFNTLALSDGDGVAGISFANTKCCFGFSGDSNINAAGTSTWLNSASCLSILRSTIPNKIDPSVLPYIETVKSYGYYSRTTSSDVHLMSEEYTSKFVMPGPFEVFGDSCESASGGRITGMGNHYPQWPYFTTVANRIFPGDPYGTSSESNLKWLLPAGYSKTYWTGTTTAYESASAIVSDDGTKIIFSGKEAGWIRFIFSLGKVLV